MAASRVLVKLVKLVILVKLVKLVKLVILVLIVTLNILVNSIHNNIIIHCTLLTLVTEVW